MGMASGCGEQEAGVASGSGWNLWVWLLGVVVRRYIDFLTLYIYSSCICSFFTAASLLFFVHFLKCFSFFVIYIPQTFLSHFLRILRKLRSIYMKPFVSLPRSLSPF